MIRRLCSVLRQDIALAKKASYALIVRAVLGKMPCLFRVIGDNETR